MRVLKSKIDELQESIGALLQTLIRNDQDSQLNTKPDPKKETFLDNQEFIMLMKVSKRTAQTWRDEGKISFSQVGSKIYYKLSDVEKLLQEHYNKSFKGR